LPGPRRVEDAATRIEPAELGGDLLGRALQEELLEDVRGLVLGRDGDAGAGPREAARAGVDAEGERGKRVSVPMCSAMCWSSETVLRNELLPGCGAAVRKQMSAGWPPSTLGCETPLKTREVVAGAPARR
jgi:hypothetical protein